MPQRIEEHPLYKLGCVIQMFRLVCMDMDRKLQAGMAAVNASLLHSQQQWLPPAEPEQASAADMPEWEFRETAHGSF